MRAEKSALFKVVLAPLISLSVHPDSIFLGGEEKMVSLVFSVRACASPFPPLGWPLGTFP